MNVLAHPECWINNYSAWNITAQCEADYAPEEVRYLFHSTVYYKTSKVQKPECALSEELNG